MLSCQALLTAYARRDKQRIIDSPKIINLKVNIPEGLASEDAMGYCPTEVDEMELAKPVILNLRLYIYRQSFTRYPSNVEYLRQRMM